MGQPVIEQPENGISIGGVRLSLGTVAGTLLTLGGLGLRVAAHFVKLPDPPKGTEKNVTQELVDYAQEHATASRKAQVMETIGHGLSDLGQLAAYKS